MRHIQHALVRFGIVAATLAVASVPTQAQDASPVFGPVGIAFGQTLRVNVVNLSNTDSPPDPCKVQVNFVNAAGQTLKTVSFGVDNGQIGWANITWLEASQARGSVNTDSSQRQVLRPVLGALPPCRAITAEVFETASGKTNVYIPPVFLPAVQSNTVGQ